MNPLYSEVPAEIIKKRVGQVRHQIKKFSAQYETIPPVLLAVSKKQTIKSINSILACGIDNFAENYLQEAEQKIPALSSAICWHYIGRVQSNKLKKIAEYFAWVHTLSEVKHAVKLQKICAEMGKEMEICIQINIDLEPQKSGILLHDQIQIDELIRTIFTVCPNLKLRGFMCMLAQKNNLQQQKESFEKLRALKDQVNAKFGVNLTQLSMGMSGDMQAAIASGSTMVRVGTAFFGQRNN